MPRPRKSPEFRQNRATKELPGEAALVVLRPVVGERAPEPDREWLAETKRQWSDLWASNLAAFIEATDEPGLRRCFMWRNELLRTQRNARVLRKAAEKEPLVEGSQGQPVATPLFAVAANMEDRALSIESKIVALEDRLALSPKARLNLGVTQQKGLNLQGQNAKLAQAIATAMGGVDGSSDPRSVPGDPTVEVG